MKHLARALGWLDRAVEALLAALLASMVLVGAAQVLARYLLRDSLAWSEEFQRFAHIWLVFLAIPVCQRRGMHLGVTLLAERLPAVGRRWLARATDVLWLAFGLCLAGYSIPLLRVARFQTSGAMELRMDWVYSVMLASGALVALAALRSLAASWRAGAPATVDGEA